MERNIDQIIDNAVDTALERYSTSPKPSTRQPTQYFAHEAKGLTSTAESQLTQIFRMRKVAKSDPAWVDAIAKLHTDAGDDRFKGKSLDQIIAIAAYAAQGKVKTDSFYKMGGI